jgi:hypothetical protein
MREQVLQGSRSSLLELRPDFDFKVHNSHLYGPIHDRLDKWRLETANRELGEDRWFDEELLLASSTIDRIASLNTILLGDREIDIFKHFVPDFEYHEEYGTEILDIVRGAQEETPKDAQKKLAYRKALQEKKEKDQQTKIAARQERRRKRYGNRLPVSELPGDYLDRHDKSRKAARPARLANFLDRIGRVNDSVDGIEGEEQNRVV